MKEYDLYVPANYNDGELVEDDILAESNDRHLSEFGGVTYFPRRNEGSWRMGDVTYRDSIVIFRVLRNGAKTTSRSGIQKSRIAAS